MVFHVVDLPFSTLNFFQQIGNAVPPPMGAAIGYEIRQCIAEVEKKIKPKAEASSVTNGSVIEDSKTSNGEKMEVGVNGSSSASCAGSTKDTKSVNGKSKTEANPSNGEGSDVAMKGH